VNKSLEKKCECCESDKITLAYKDSFFGLPVLKCGNCSLHFVPIVNKNELKEYYAMNYWPAVRERNKAVSEQVCCEPKTREFSKIITKMIDLSGVRKSRALSQYNYLKSSIRGNNLLEIGAGEGHALEFFEKKGFHVFGIEPGKNNASLINKKLKKGKCHVGFAEDSAIFNTTFDIIIMSHVLEHTTNCRELLFNLKQKLSNDGMLFIEVPNCANEKTVSESINEPHVYYFTKKSLYELVVNLGYQVIKADTFNVKNSSKIDHIKYLLSWFLKRDCYLPSTSDEGDFLRMIIKNRMTK
jgi:2-polyprenyl-3-methyl-5-hydroxy-6-metoxy-1,4-benzoquinol methylase